MIELTGDRLPALSIAWTEKVFEVCVPYVIHLSMPIRPLARPVEIDGGAVAKTWYVQQV